MESLLESPGKADRESWKYEIWCPSLLSLNTQQSPAAPIGFHLWKGNCCQTAFVTVGWFCPLRADSSSSCLFFCTLQFWIRPLGTCSYLCFSTLVNLSRSSCVKCHDVPFFGSSFSHLPWSCCFCCAQVTTFGCSVCPRLAAALAAKSTLFLHLFPRFLLLWGFVCLNHSWIPVRLTQLEVSSHLT